MAALTCTQTGSPFTRQQHYKMSIAFLAGDVTDSSDVEMSDNEATPSFRLPSYQYDSRPRTPVTLPSLRLDSSPFSSHQPTQLPRIGSFSSLHSTSSNASANSWASNNTFSSVHSSFSSNSSFGSANHSFGSHQNGSFCSINNSSPIKRHDSLWDAESPSAGYSSFHSINHNVSPPHPGYPHSHHAGAETLARIPRPARPSYSEEQKFFIMFYRIIKELSWPEIEDKFAHFFNLRTKDGLTSVYYRIRKTWGMEEVLKTGPDGSMGDRRKVEDKAAHFSREFLGNLGYFEQ